MLGDNLTYKQFGEKAILMEWESKIDDEILKEILHYKEKIIASNDFEFADLIQGYSSLTIIYKSIIIDFQKEIQHIKSIFKSTLLVKNQDSFQWEVPVCYDLKFGIDLVEISKQSNLSIDEIIDLHSQAVYQVYFIGFLPGFLYLGGLNEKLFFDRKSNPRLNIAKGSVGIGGMQTGVYPNQSAGGWNIIGKTPINFFDIENESPCFANAGDFIKFKSICLEEFSQLEKTIKNNTYQHSKTLINA